MAPLQVSVVLKPLQTGFEDAEIEEGSLVKVAKLPD
jgi:hypothetical protein